MAPPDVCVHVYGEVPPTAVNVAEYGEATVPLGREVVDTCTIVVVAPLLQPVACKLANNTPSKQT
jgi:hypothetical protein